MIDTIVLTLTKDMFEISEPDKFEPCARWILTDNFNVSRGIQSKQNPTKKELLKGIYKPRLTLSYRINKITGRAILLKIELSLPKLLFGNNFDELKYKDFLPLAKKLAATLQQMGIITTAQVFGEISVS